MRPTIKDIAKVAGVSHTTVSRALNHSLSIKEETKEKIFKVANQLNYVPNYNARSLVLNKSYTVGLFFTSIANGTSSSFLADVIKGVNVAIEEKFNLYVRGIDDYQDYKLINRQRFDGIILLSQSDEDDQFIQHVLDQKIPLVVLNREMKDDRCVINILSNDRDGVYDATKYLFMNGHRKIAFIEGKQGFKSTKERKEGFLDAYIDLHLNVENQYVVQGANTMQSGYEAMKVLLTLANRPTAVFCSNDDMAIGAMKAVFSEGLSVPSDISIIGFDDIGVAQYTTPALTTVKRPIEKISEKGTEQLLEIMNNELTKQVKIFLGTQLIERDSVIQMRTIDV